jgi:hypothetical protein
MRGLRLGFAVVVSAMCMGAVPATHAGAATPRSITISASASWRGQPGGNVTFTGTVSPNAHGQTVALQQRGAANQPWKTVKTMKVNVNSKYKFLRYFPAVGVFHFRTKIANVVSKVKRVTVYKWHFLADMPTAATSGGCVTFGSAQIRSITYAHGVTMDLTCATDVWADWHFAKGCRLFNSVVFFADASSGDAQATLSMSVGGHLGNALTVAESDFSAPGQHLPLAGQTDMRLEAGAPSGTTPIAAYGDPAIQCAW